MKKIALCFAILLPVLSWANDSNTQPDHLEELSRTLSGGNYVHSDPTYKVITQKFVNTNRLNVRNKPNDGEIVSHLSRGQSVFIYERSGAWERISQENELPKWVSSTLLCSGVNCYSQRVSTVISSSTRSTPTPRPATRSYGATCPCSGSTNCVGPRGGTYCYTSGGNKRYR